VDLRITCAFVDSGYARTDVYRFTSRRRKRGVFAVKGVAGPLPLIGKVSIDKRYHTYLVPLGVDEAKAKIYQRLQNEPKSLRDGRRGGPGVIHFNEKATDNYFKQLTSEKRVVVYQKGFPVRRWKLPDGRRNEALDTAVYALCAKEFLPSNTIEKHRKRIQEETSRIEASTETVGEPVDPTAHVEEVKPPPKRPTIRKPRRPGSGFVNAWRK